MSAGGPQLARSTDGTAIAWVEIGQGPALVIVHGSLSTREDWLPVANLLASDFTCFVMDRRGRGDSGDARDHAIHREREDVESVLQRAGPGAQLLGHSYGALCALEAARRTRVERLVLYEPPLQHSGPDADAIAERVEAEFAAGRVNDGLAAFLTGGPGLSQDEIAMLRTTPIWPRMQQLAPGLPRELAAVRSLRSDYDRYGDLACPTLLLLGELSPEGLRDASAELAQRLSKARTHELPGQAHVANLLAPDAVADAVRRFLLE